MVLELPLVILFELVVTLGAAALAWAIAPGDRRERGRWCGCTVAVSFAWHRAVAWAVGEIVPAQPWPLVLTIGASAVVFIGAPIVLPLLIGAVLRRRLPARWPPP